MPYRLTKTLGCWQIPSAGPGAILDPMSPGEDRASGMKSAYELALERMEGQGIERPKEEGLSQELRDRLAEVRSRAEAKLAELEILHRDELAATADPDQRAQGEREYVEERRRIEARRDAEIEKLRRDG